MEEVEAPQMLDGATVESSNLELLEVIGSDLCSFCFECPEKQSNLLWATVHAYFRHGDRTPTPLGEIKSKSELWASRVQEVPPALQNKEYFPQKYPWGFLTTKGAEQARDLGIWLREHYIPEISKSGADVQSPEKLIHLRTTNFLRTHLTAWFLLEGFLRSTEAPASIEFTCRAEKDENLYHNDHCPRLKIAWEQAWTAAKESVGADGLNWRDHLKEMQAIMALALNITTDNAGFLASMDSLGFPWVTAIDTLECTRSHGDSLPEGISEENVVEVWDLLAHDYAQSFQKREVLQLAIGTLVRELVEALLDRVNDKQSSPHPSLYLYSGHDATIMPLSVALGLPWSDWPGYTSCICVELWRSKSGEHFVHVLYNGEEVALPLSHVEGAPKKVMLTMEEFHEIAKWSIISETEFSSRCPDLTGLLSAPNPVVV